jgi:hypothetical protein
MQSTRPRGRHDLPHVEIDGELVLYDMEGNGLHHLNRTATLVFKCLDGESTPAEIAEDIADVSGQPLGEVQVGVEQLVEDFTDQGLIERDGDDAEENADGAG